MASSQRSNGKQSIATDVAAQSPPQLPDLFSGYRHELFCREYLKDGNATRAARDAGYSPHSAASQASRLLTNVNIQRRLDELAVEAVTSAKVTTDYVRSQLHGIVKVATQGADQLPDDHYAPAVAVRALEALGKTTGAFAADNVQSMDTRVEIIFRTADDAEGVNRRIIHVNGSQPLDDT